MSFIGGAAGAVLVAIEFSALVASIIGGADLDKQTTVRIILGDAPNSEGSMPDIHVLGPSGNYIAGTSDHTIHHDEHLEGGRGHTFVMSNVVPGHGPNNDGLNPPEENETRVEPPQQVAVVAKGSDAICISAISAGGNEAQYIWTGDLGHYCGAQWVRTSMYGPLGNDH